MYQRENESVSKFANRVVDCGETLIEVYKLENTPNAENLETFKISTAANVRVCFKRGLRPEIEQRLGNSDSIDELVKNAITIERELYAKSALRSQTNTSIPAKSSKGRFSNIQHDTNVILESDDEEETAALAYQANETKRVTFKEQYKCGWCYGPHGTRECPLLADKKEELTKSMSQEVTCNWCLKKGHSMRTCWLAQKECFDLYKIPTQSKTSESNKGCNYCKDPNHLIENCPKRPKPENISGSWRNQKNESTPFVKSDQKGQKMENRSLNWVRID